MEKFTFRDGSECLGFRARALRYFAFRDLRFPGSTECYRAYALRPRYPALGVGIFSNTILKVPNIVMVQCISKPRSKLLRPLDVFRPPCCTNPHTLSPKKAIWSSCPASPGRTLRRRTSPARVDSACAYYRCMLAGLGFSLTPGGLNGSTISEGGVFFCILCLLLSLFLAMCL